MILRMNSMKEQSEERTAEQRAAGQTRGAVSTAQGRWGEQIASDFMEGKGWVVLGRNIHPCARDRRCEIDLIVRSRDRRSVVFVEVKTHKVHSSRASRLWRITAHKKALLLRACTNWILVNKWHGNFRFDVIEVYGSHDSPTPPEIDHMENVPLFPPKWRFW